MGPIARAVVPVMPRRSRTLATSTLSTMSRIMKVLKCKNLDANLRVEARARATPGLCLQCLVD